MAWEWPAIILVGGGAALAIFAWPRPQKQPIAGRRDPRSLLFVWLGMVMVIGGILLGIR